MKITKGAVPITGIAELDIDLVVEKWNHLWALIENRRANEWQLIKYIRKDSPRLDIKLTISKEQANELIERVDLTDYGSCFASYFTWVRDKDVQGYS